MSLNSSVLDSRRKQNTGIFPFSTRLGFHNASKAALKLTKKMKLINYKLILLKSLRAFLLILFLSVLGWLVLVYLVGGVLPQYFPPCFGCQFFNIL